MARSGKPIEPGIIARVANGFRGMVKGFNDNQWFSPGAPPAPQEQTSARAFDYPVGYNQQFKPRPDDKIDFDQLRALSENCDILRLAIETRKDQMGSLEFNIQAKDKIKGKESAAKTVFDKLRYPDSEHTWSTWLRMLVEELLVIDAPVVYPRWQLDGNLYGLELIDGSTIKRVIDYQGRTPIEGAAYQQYIKGVVIANFTRDELVYKPRNPRIHKVYGYSPVEQIITTVNLQLRRQTSQFNYYTDGNIPDLFISTPVGWTPEMIAKFQANWDLLMNGPFGAHRGAKFIPPGMEITRTKEPDLKTEFDEWLTRIICFSFSLPPTPFIKQMNRSTAEAAQETALQEGLAPLKQWVKELMDYVIAKYFKEPDLEFVWQAGETEQDPLTQSQIHQNYINAKVISPRQVAEELGVEYDETLEQEAEDEAKPKVKEEK